MDQLSHLIRHVAQQGGDPTPFRYGHIATYDHKLHRVRCIIPSMTDQDGNPLLSPWMPLGTLSAGSGYGMQVYYQGGATAANPTGGEQVLIATFDRQRGVSAVPCTFFHSSSLPPSTNLPDEQDGFSVSADPSLPGDIIISAPPADAGGPDSHNTSGGPNTFLRLRKDGTIQIWSAGQISANIIGGLTAVVNTGDVDLSVMQGNVNTTISAGNATVTASGTVSVFASAIKLGASAANALLQLCNTRLFQVYNAHGHPGGGPPQPQAPPDALTTVLTAE